MRKIYTCGSGSSRWIVCECRCRDMAVQWDSTSTRIDNMNHSSDFNQWAGSQLAHHHNRHSAICPAAIYHFQSLHYLCHNSIRPPSTGTNCVDTSSMQLTLCTSGWNVKLIYLPPLVMSQYLNLLGGTIILLVLCGKIIMISQWIALNVELINQAHLVE